MVSNVSGRKIADFWCDVQVLRRYDVAAVNNAQPLKLKDPVTFMSTDFWIRFTKREGVEV